MVPNFVCCPAAASGCRLSLPDRQSTKDFVDSENSGILIYGSRIRRQNPRQQVAVGPADPAAASGCRPCLPGGSKWLSALPTRRKQVAVGPADRKGCLLNVWTLRKE